MSNGRGLKKQSNKLYVGIVGCRDFENKNAFLKGVERFLPIPEFDGDTNDGVVIISDGARGADTLAEQFAAKFYVDEPWVFKPEQDIIDEKGFAAAAHARNQEIVDASDFIIAFWDGVSTGTKDTINKTQRAKKPVVIVWI